MGILAVVGIEIGMLFSAKTAKLEFSAFLRSKGEIDEMDSLFTVIQDPFLRKLTLSPTL